jgi:quercetin dioxygenase-like cupin family protein
LDLLVVSLFTPLLHIKPDNMNRRLFLQFPLVAAPLSLEAKRPRKNRPKKGIKVQKDKDRNNESLELGRVGSRIDSKVSSEDSDKDLYIYESRTVGKGGPPLHIHPHQDEWIYVLQGKYVFQVGEETFQLEAGDSLFAPRNVPHAFTYEGEGLGKMIIVFQPAGKMEAFFLEAHQIATLKKQLTLAEQKDMWRRHDMELVGSGL